MTNEFKRQDHVRQRTKKYFLPTGLIPKTVLLPVTITVGKTSETKKSVHSYADDVRESAHAFDH